MNCRLQRNGRVQRGRPAPAPAARCSSSKGQQQQAGPAARRSSRSSGSGDSCGSGKIGSGCKGGSWPRQGSATDDTSSSSRLQRLQDAPGGRGGNQAGRRVGVAHVQCVLEVELVGGLQLLQVLGQLAVLHVEVNGALQHVRWGAQCRGRGGAVVAPQRARGAAPPPYFPHRCDRPAAVDAAAMPSHRPASFARSPASINLPPGSPASINLPPAAPHTRAPAHLEPLVPLVQHLLGYALQRLVDILHTEGKKRAAG